MMAFVMVERTDEKLVACLDEIKVEKMAGEMVENLVVYLVEKMAVQLVLITVA